MPLSPLLGGVFNSPTVTDYANEAANQQLAQQHKRLQAQSAQDEMQNKRRALAVSMLNGLSQEQDPAKQASLYATLRPMAERYDPSLKLPEMYDPGLTKALYYSQISPADQLAMQSKLQGGLPQGYRMNPQTGMAELIPGVDPSFGKRADSLLQVYNPTTGQLEFQPKPVVAGGGFQPPSAAPAPKKPMPAAALKMQQEEIDAARLAGTIDADLGKFKSALETGDLNLSLGGNLASRFRNATGFSDQNSRNFASFRAALEKMRNDSLRLNKGVQTEGDAQRAWNELFENINDEKMVAQRLQEISDINRRAATFRRMNVDSIRSNYGLDSIDDSSFTTEPAVLPGSEKNPAAAGPKKGAIVNGYIYQGGDPNNQASWKPAR